MRPKTTLRAANRAARAAHMRSQSGLGGHLGQTAANLAPKSPSEAFRTPFWPLGARFWPLRGLILEGAPGPPRGRTKLTSGRPSGIILPDTPLNTWPGGMREAIK